jgi:hypothetical protein
MEKGFTKCFESRYKNGDIRGFSNRGKFGLNEIFENPLSS